MKSKPNNYGRFYSAVREYNPIGDRDEFKRILVRQYTHNRTDSLREMTVKEYDRCCRDLERKVGGREGLRKARSATLRLMQKIGVDTTDWGDVDAFCLSKRIIGKRFWHITLEEHQELQRKLYGIRRKAGLSRNREEEPEPPMPRVQQIIINPRSIAGEA